MNRFRLLAALVVLSCGIASWPQTASAAAAGDFELKLNYWPATSNWSFSNGTSGSWNTQFYGGDLRWTSAGGWGVHLKYDTGAESSWGGYLAGLATTSGQDTVWSGDVFYAWHLSTVTLRGFVGYGSIQVTDSDPVFGNVNITMTGWRWGADAMIPLPNTGFAFNATAAVYSSTNIAFSDRLASSTGSGSATDYGASVQYTWPSGLLAEVGYRWITTNTSALGGTACPCTITANGPVVAVGYHW